MSKAKRNIGFEILEGPREIKTLQDWEQGRRAPSGAAKTLLLIAARNPRVLLEVA